jgi:hypothetical protein
LEDQCDKADGKYIPVDADINALNNVANGLSFRKSRKSLLNGNAHTG